MEVHIFYYYYLRCDFGGNRTINTRPIQWFFDDGEGKTAQYCDVSNGVCGVTPEYLRIPTFCGRKHLCEGFGGRIGHREELQSDDEPIGDDEPVLCREYHRTNGLQVEG